MIHAFYASCGISWTYLKQSKGRTTEAIRSAWNLHFLEIKQIFCLTFLIFFLLDSTWPDSLPCYHFHLLVLIHCLHYSQHLPTDRWEHGGYVLHLYKFPHFLLPNVRRIQHGWQRGWIRFALLTIANPLSYKIMMPFDAVVHSIDISSIKSTDIAGHLISNISDRFQWFEYFLSYSRTFKWKSCILFKLLLCIISRSCSNVSKLTNVEHKVLQCKWTNLDIFKYMLVASLK